MSAASPLCSADGCGSSARRRGMCGRHYLRWWRATPIDARSETARDLTDEGRFWQKVERAEPSSCWLWLGAKRPSGHGQAVVRGEKMPAAAAALEFSGSPRPGMMLALHRCDNPPCVNPRHLYWGTHQDNANDAWARGRMAAGEKRPGLKLTDATVREIRERYAAGEPGAALAAECGVAKPTVYLITSGKKRVSAGGPITRKR